MHIQSYVISDPRGAELYTLTCVTMLTTAQGRAAHSHLECKGNKIASVATVSATRSVLSRFSYIDGLVQVVGCINGASQAVGCRRSDKRPPHFGPSLGEHGAHVQSCPGMAD